MVVTDEARFRCHRPVCCRGHLAGHFRRQRLRSPALAHHFYLLRVPTVIGAVKLWWTQVRTAGGKQESACPADSLCLRWMGLSACRAMCCRQCQSEIGRGFKHRGVVRDFARSSATARAALPALAGRSPPTFSIATRSDRQCRLPFLLHGALRRLECLCSPCVHRACQVLHGGILCRQRCRDCVPEARHGCGATAASSSRTL